MKFLITALALISLNTYAQEESAIPFKPPMIGGTFAFNGPYYIGSSNTQAITTGLFSEKVPFLSSYEELFHDIEMGFRIEGKGENSRSGNTYTSTSTVQDIRLSGISYDGKLISETQIKCVGGEAIVTGKFESTGSIKIWDNFTPSGKENEVWTPPFSNHTVTFNIPKTIKRGDKTIATRTAMHIQDHEYETEYYFGHAETHAICK